MARAFESQVYGGHRPQTLTGDMILHGIGIMRVEPEDFHRDHRNQLARSIEMAYNHGAFTEHSEMHRLALRVHQALGSQESMLEALRTHLGVSEEQMKPTVKRVAALVPDVWRLWEWM